MSFIKIDNNIEPVRGPPSTAMEKRFSSHSSSSSKRKPFYLSSSTHSLLGPKGSDKVETPQEKKSAPAVSKTQACHDPDYMSSKVLRQLSTELNRIPEEVLAMGNELISRRIRLLEFIRTLQRKGRILVHDDTNNKQWQTLNLECDEEIDKLRNMVTTTANSLETRITQILSVAKFAKIETLQKEISLTKNDKHNGDFSVGSEDTEDHKLKKLLSELCKERAARVTLKEMLTTADVKLIAARARATELARQLNLTRMELASAQRRREHSYRVTNHEARSNRSEKALKTDEVTIEELLRQRDTLQLRVTELQQQVTALIQEGEMRDAPPTPHVECLKIKLEEQVKKSEGLETRVLELEKTLKDMTEQYNMLRERSQELISIEYEKCLEYLPRKGQCTNDDLDIWKDLQASQAALIHVKQELEHSRADKDELLSSLATIAHQCPENKIVEILLNREQKIIAMGKSVYELMEIKKTLEQKISTYESQLTALRFEVNALRNINSYKSAGEIERQELETEVFNLCLQVEALKRERGALVSEAAANALALERHERCADLFARVTRARRELAAQLEGSSAPSIGGTCIHEVSNSLSKAYISGATTWSALRAERTRVLQLEDTIKSQRVQLDRDSSLRVQGELRRAELERELIRTWAKTSSRHCPK